MRRSIVYILLIGCLIGSLSGCSIKSRVKRADKKYAIGEYYDASEIYKQVYGHINPKKDRELKSEIAYKQGECYRVLNNYRAVNSYKNAIRYKYQDSIVYLHYAQVLQYQAKYAEAEKNYSIYLDQYQ